MSTNKPVVIKKVKKVIGGGHHGGAWKVAYADFVTAMMAFFLLMWLINTTSPEQKRGIADYFAPASVSSSTQGSDGLLGGTAFQEDGARSSGSNLPIAETQTSRTRKRAGDPGDAGEGSEGEASDAAMSTARARRAEGAEFESAELSLRQALQDMPDLAELSKQVVIDQTPEGLRIQLIDQEGRAMFSGSSAQPLPRTQQLLEAVSKVIETLPHQHRWPHRQHQTQPRRLFQLGAVIRPRQRRPPHSRSQRNRRRPHLPGHGQGGLRTPLPGRS
jgi:chemotaxis protein MotB